MTVQLHTQSHDDFFDQLELDAGPVTVINRYTVDADATGQFLAEWQIHAAYMKRCPGYICTQLYRSIGTWATFANLVVWESTRQLRAAVTAPEFTATMQAYPDSLVASPHIYTTHAVPGICTG